MPKTKTEKPQETPTNLLVWKLTPRYRMQALKAIERTMGALEGKGATKKQLKAFEQFLLQHLSPYRSPNFPSSYQHSDAYHSENALYALDHIARVVSHPRFRLSMLKDLEYIVRSAKVKPTDSTANTYYVPRALMLYNAMIGNRHMPSDLSEKFFDALCKVAKYYTPNEIADEWVPTIEGPDFDFSAASLSLPVQLPPREKAKASLSDTDPKKRRKAMQTLMRSKKISRKEKVGVMVGMLADSDPLVRWDAVSALGELGDRAAVPFLVSSLGDPHPQVRMTAAHVLGEMGDERAYRPLASMMSKDPNENAQAVAARAVTALLKKAKPRKTKKRTNVAKR